MLLREVGIRDESQAQSSLPRETGQLDHFVVGTRCRAFYIELELQELFLSHLAKVSLRETLINLLKSHLAAATPALTSSGLRFLAEGDEALARGGFRKPASQGRLP